MLQLEEKIEKLKRDIDDNYLLMLEILGDEDIKQYKESYISNLHEVLEKLFIIGNKL